MQKAPATLRTRASTICPCRKNESKTSSASSTRTAKTARDDPMENDDKNVLYVRPLDWRWQEWTVRFRKLEADRKSLTQRLKDEKVDAAKPIYAHAYRFEE